MARAGGLGTFRHQFIILLVAGAWASGLACRGDTLQVTHFNVGQADAALIRCPDGKHHLLIDSGDTRYPDSSASFHLAMSNAFYQQPKDITVAVASHPHSDHIGSMQWVLENFKVHTYIDNGEKVDSTMFGKLDQLRARLAKKGSVTYVNGKENSFSKIDFCPLVSMEIFEPWADADLSDTNDRSVGVRLQYINAVFLFVGDMETPAERVMLNRYTPDQRRKLEATVLKVGHHGSDTSSSAEFINAVAPSVVVVSCGKKDVGTNAGYKHPRLSTVRHYADFAKTHPGASVHPAPAQVWTYNADTKKWQQAARPADMWLTVADGPVTIRTDGTKVEVDPHQ